MSWPKYFILAWIVIIVLSILVGVGKPRRATTGEQAAGALVIWGLICALVVIA